MRLRSVKVLIASAVVAVGAPTVLASVAGAGERPGGNEIFQLALVDTDQYAKADSGDNSAWNDINQGGGTDNDAKYNEAEVKTGDASASNSNSTYIRQELEVEHETELGGPPLLSIQQEPNGPSGCGCGDVEQKALVWTDQTAKADSGDNQAWNQINQGGGTYNDANGNEAEVKTGDATASNHNSTTIKQEMEVETETELFLIAENNNVTP